MERIEVKNSVLAANSEAAARNRRLFEAHGTVVLNLMSAPGAGKTTLLEATIRGLHSHHKIAVIEGDLQTDLDSQRIRMLGIPAHQITTGTVCHLDARMVSRALNELPLRGINLLVIENVGNLICPASYDLGERFRVVLCSAAEGAEKPKKYPVMFNKADVVLLNKADLAVASGVDLDEMKRNIKEVNPTAAIFVVSCRTGAGLECWLDWLKEAIVSNSVASVGSR
jgi:hydrogenase nickel incorporation protein HypB